MVFCFLFFQQEKEGPAGVWGRGLSRPQRRDLRGPKKISVPGVWGRFPRRAGEMSRSDKRGRPACGTPKNCEAVSFKNTCSAWAGRKAFSSVKLKASSCARVRAGRKIMARWDLQGPIIKYKTAGVTACVHVEKGV